MTFRLYYDIVFDREISKETDNICLGGFDFTFGDGTRIQFDFMYFEANIDEKDRKVLHVMHKEPDEDEFPEMSRLTKKLLANVREIHEWRIAAETEEGCPELHPVKIKNAHFCLVLDDEDTDTVLKPLPIRKSVLERITPDMF